MSRIDLSEPYIPGFREPPLMIFMPSWMIKFFYTESGF
jgi:hypothetical protein